MAEDVDLIIVGAGAAGIGAGLAARAAGGISFRILEAKSRAGGRAHTIDAAGIPYDLGCHYLHSASRNPFTPLALQEGGALGVRRTNKTFPQAFYRDGIRQPEGVRAACEAFYTACYEAEISAEGDVAASTVIDTTSPFYDMYSAWFAAISGVPPERCSVADLQAYGDTGEDWPVANGYGAVITSLTAGLPITYDCPVQSIDRTGDRVRVETAEGTLNAKHVIVSVSTAVLTKGAIQFTPALPDQIQSALTDTPLGYAERVVLVTDGRITDEVPLYGHIVTTTGQALHVTFHEGDTNTIGGYISGDLALGLAQEGGEQALIDCTEAAAVEMFGSSLRSRIIHRQGSCWSTDQHILGGYSASLPGRAASRAVLAERFDERLTLVGEAVSADYYSTAHGAYMTGMNAVTSLAVQDIL